MEETKNKKINQTDDFIEFGELLLLCARKWHWFLISFLIAGLLAMFYIVKTPSAYKRTAEVQIKSNTEGGQSVTVQKAFSDMGGLIGMNTNVVNELRALLSSDVMFEVVQRLNLDVNYAVDGTFHDNVLYGSDLPVFVHFLKLSNNDNVGCDVKVSKDLLSVELTNFTYFEDGKLQELDEQISSKVGDTLNTVLGPIVVEQNPYFKGVADKVIHVNRINLYSSQEIWSGCVTVTQEEEKADILTLSVIDVSTERGDDVLNMMIKVYNERWIKDKNVIADGTSMFINDRLKIIETELSTVDNDISSYKSKNLLPDVKAAADIYMQENANISNQLRELESQLYMTNYIRDYLSVQKNSTSSLPVSSGMQNTNIEMQIAQYNDKMIIRNRLESNSSSENELVKQYDEELATMRKSILVSIDNHIAAISNQVRTLKRSEQQALSRISSNPKQAEMLLSAERQQAVKEALYLFLLQKREENELSQSFTAYNTRIIKRPGGSQLPHSPVKRNILLIALAVGLVIPLAVIYVKEAMNTTLRGKKDLENLDIPLFAEIPIDDDSKKWNLLSKRNKTQLEAVVKEGNRNAINEAFRVLRTNMEFAFKPENNVVMFTSFNAESGKSFLCLNSALAFAFKGKKVLVIDGDMRHASLSKWACPEKYTDGLSSLLDKKCDLSKAIEKSVNDVKGFDVLPVGEIPNNPSELIGNGILGDVIAALKQSYDYIFIDCPPVDVVADARIIETYADETMFAIRSGLLDRSLLGDLSDFYNEKRFKNLHLILNGTAMAKGKYSYRNRYHSSSYFSFS